MVANDNFILTVTKGSILHRADGSFLRLDEIPDSAFQMWKDGSKLFSLRASGTDILNGLSLQELQEIYSKRVQLDFKVELEVLLKAIKAKMALEKQKKKSNSTDV